MDFRAFKKLTREIAKQGVNRATASYYASCIGDLPVHDGAGRVLVIDAGQVVARLKPLKFFGA